MIGSIRVGSLEGCLADESAVQGRFANDRNESLTILLSRP